MPLLNPDELCYTLAARALSDGDWLGLRGHGYDRAASIGTSDADGLPLDSVDVGSGGRLLRPDGKPLVADHVVTQPGIELKGRRLYSRTGADLVLWETHGVVRLADADLTVADLVTADCD